MNGRRVVMAAALLPALASAALLDPLWHRATEAIRGRLVAALEDVFAAPVAIEGLRIGLFPPRLDATAFRVGADGELITARDVAVRLEGGRSLRQLRPFGAASIAAVRIDLPALIERIDAALEADEPDAAESASTLPAFRLAPLSIGAVELRIGAGEDPVDVRADALSGRLASALGRLQFAARGRGITVARRGETLALDTLRVAGGESARGWRLTELAATGEGIEVGSGARRGGQLPVQARLDLERLAFADEGLEPLGGTAELDVDLGGPLEEPRVAGRVRVEALRWDAESIGDVTVRAAWSPERLQVESARLEGFGGSVEASGRLTLAGALAYEAQARWTDLSLGDVPGLREQALQPATASGSVTLSGTFEPLAVRGEGGGTVVPREAGPPLEWQATADYGAARGTVELRATQAGANSIRGRVVIGPEAALAGALDVTIAQPTALNVLLPIESTPDVSGSLTARLDLAGTTEAPQVSGRLDGADVIVLGVPLDALSGRFAADRAAVRVDGITADLWQGSITFAGTVALDVTVANDWRLRVEQMPGEAAVALVDGLTGVLPPIGRGRLDAEVVASGPWAGLRLTARAVLAEFWLTKEWIDRAAVEASIAWPRWEAQATVRNPKDEQLVIRASGDGAAAVELRALCEAWTLTALEGGALSGSGGTLALDAELAGPLQALSGEATLRADAFSLGGLHLGDVRLDVEATRGRWQLATALLEEAVRLRATVSPAPGAPFQLDGDWESAEFGRLVAGRPDVVIDTTGSVQAAGRLDAIDQLTASARIARLRIVNGAYELALVAPATLSCREGTCRLDALELGGDATTLRVEGRLGFDGSVAATLDGRGELRVLEILGAVASARGRFAIDAEVRRQGGALDVDGSVGLDDVGLDFGGPVAITRGRGRLRLSGSTIRIEELGGGLGGGTFAIEGGVDLDRGPDLTWTLSEVAADPVPSLETEFSGRGTVTGTWQRLRVAGRVEIDQLLYDRDFELADLLPSFNRALDEAPRRPSARTVELALAVVAPGQLYVDNNIARIEARSDLRVRGTTGRPVLDGRVEVLDGQVEFRGRTFDIVGATVDFRPDLGLRAALNITAESTIETPDATYTVIVRVTGTTADPRVALRSDDPALTQTDIATLIALGKTTAQLRQGSGAGFSVLDAFSFGAKQVTGAVTGEAQQLLPIDRISFEPTFSRTTGAFEPELKLGKDLSDQLAVSVGQTFGVESRTSAEADYRLTPRLFTTLGWESETSTQDGAFSGGVKLRYEFWRVTPYTLLGAPLR